MKCLPRGHDNHSSESQNPCKTLCTMVCACNPYAGEVETMHAGKMETGWPATLTKSDYLMNIIDSSPVTKQVGPPPVPVCCPIHI